MTGFEESPNKYPLPPILTIAVLALSWCLHKYLPLGWEPDQVSGFMRSAGLVLITLAVLLDVWSLMTFRKHRANIMPHRAATTLLMSGPFALSRNPIYLANVLLVAGFGLLLGSRWFLIGAVLLFFLLDYLAIRREEKHLAANFPQMWDQYRLLVRRWI